MGLQESALATQEKLLQELKDEINFFKEQDNSIVQVCALRSRARKSAADMISRNQDNKKMATELNELRLQIERLQYDNKEGNIMLDSVKEQNGELTAEIEELRVRCYSRSKDVSV